MCCIYVVCPSFAPSITAWVDGDRVECRAGTGMHISEVDAVESGRSVVEVARSAAPQMLMMTALGTALAAHRPARHWRPLRRTGRCRSGARAGSLSRGRHRPRADLPRAKPRQCARGQRSGPQRTGIPPRTSRIRSKLNFVAPEASEAWRSAVGDTG